MTRGQLVRTGTLSVACLALLWLTVSVTVAGVFRAGKPDWALSLRSDARALAVASQQPLMNPARPDGDAARRLAQEALARDPTAIDAVTTLGLVAVLRNDLPMAERSFRYAEHLSRRNGQTHVWLIERQVQNNNIDGALTQYDTALRTSNDLRAQLFPILISAVSDPNIAPRVNRLLLTRPNWYADFTAKLAYEGRDPVAMTTVTRGLLDPAREDHRQWLAAMLPRLIQMNRLDLAWQAYEGLPRMAANARAPLRDGNFSQEQPLAPFDWAYNGESDLAPERRALGGAAEDGFALYLPAPDRAGDAARQALRLAPGAHSLTATAGDVSGDVRQRPFVQIRCATSDQPLLRQTLPDAGPEGAPMRGAFTVPAGCPYQWITIGVQARDGDARSATAWIARLSIR